MKDKRNYQKMITTKLQSLSGKQNISTVFFDWVHMMAYAFSNSVDKEQYEEREAAYLATVGKYTREEACLFGDCLGLLTMAFEYKVQDWLGAIYMELNINSKNNRRLYWPPSWIECDCGELAKQVREKKGDHFYPNGRYLCNTCHREYEKVDGYDRFDIVHDEKKI